MKLVLAVVCFIIFSSLTLFAQSKVDIVILKNGDIYKGQLIKDVPGDYLQLQLKDGSVQKILYSEIEKREIIENNENNEDVTNKEKSKRKLGYGGKLGLSYTNIIYKNSSDDFKAGIAIGGFLNFPIGEKNSIQTELLYVQHGSKDTYNGIDYSINANILAIPVIYNLTLSSGENSKFNLFPGIGFGFNLSTNVNATENGQENSVDISDEMNSIVLFSTLGISYDTKINKEMSLIFDLRANTSITNLMKSDASSESTDLSVYFTIGLGF